jgi:predicted MFS family arabinose efflux permease
MQKLQIKEEIMAVATLLALGMLAVLATNGNATYGQTNVVYGQTSKAWFAVCMWVYDWRFDNREIVYGCVRDALGLGAGGGAFIGSTIYLMKGVARAAVIGGLAGFAVITA